MATLKFFNRAKQDSSCNSVSKPPKEFTGALKPHNRVHLLGLLAALALVGCTTPNATQDPAASRALLLPFKYLTDAQTDTSRQNPSSEGNIKLRRPTAMSVLDNEIYLVDTELNRIFRYNLDKQTSIPFTNLSTTAGMSIFAAPDKSVYVTDPARAEILHFAWDGTPLASFVSSGNLKRPVSITVDEPSEQVLVADGLTGQIIVFDNLGATQSVIKPQRPVDIAAMATGPDGIYVADRISHLVIVFGWDGAFRYTLGAKELGDPGAIAVTRDNLVFVGDSLDQTIKGYRGKEEEQMGYRGKEEGHETKEGVGKFVAEVGGAGTAPGNFNGIAGLAVTRDMLYVTDSLNSRVQIMKINRPCAPADTTGTGKSHLDEPVTRVGKT